VPKSENPKLISFCWQRQQQSLIVRFPLQQPGSNDSLLRDKEAVVAGLTLSYSNGPVEAQVQKLKLVKRSMFGRAKLPLLRQRLLHAV
jgi:hypothetical protein